MYIIVLLRINKLVCYKNDCMVPSPVYHFSSFQTGNGLPV